MDQRNDDESSGNDGPVLSPDDLDLEGRDGVAKLPDGRYIIGASDDPGVADGPSNSQRPTDREVDRSTAAELDARTVRRWQESQLTAAERRYGFQAAIKNGERVNYQQSFSDDVTATFDALLGWYARQVGEDTPIEEVLAILLMESDLRIRYPVSALELLLSAHDLDPDDSIEELVTAVRRRGEVTFPPDRATGGDLDAE